MSSAGTKKAATIIAAAYHGGPRPGQLPPDCAPQNTADALTIQAELTKLLGERVVGWKGGVKRDGAVLYGAILASRLWASPARVKAACVPMLGVEAEIAFIFDRELKQRDVPYTRAEIAAHVSAAVAIEVVDTRFSSYTDAPFLDRAADLMSNGGLILSTPQPDWQSADFAAVTVVLTVGGKEIVRRTGGHANVDPLLPAVDLANSLARTGTVPKGSVMTTGTFSGLSHAKPGDLVIVEFVGFGSAEVAFTA